MAGYTTRQSTYTDGDVIDAADSNDEFDAILAAFGAASGHAHDGSAGEGSRITVVGTASDNVTFGTALTPDANGTIDIGTSGAQFKDLYIDGVGYIDGLQLTSGATVSTILDEDTMASNSATALATQQSIKAYVDSQVTAQDLDLTSDSGTIAIDLDSETLTVAGGTGIDTSASLNTLTVAIDSTVATLTGTQTLTNKTLTAPVIGTISNTGTLTLPTSTDTLVGRATTDTLTNKTLTSPVISTISNTGTLTLPTSTDTLVGRATTDTLTNKTINLGSNTVTGTTAQFNAALSDGDFATKAGTETLTNKTVNLTSNTLTGTTAQFNTALSDGDFATLAGTETLTNKTVNLTSNTLTGTTAQFNTALSDGSFATLAGSETLTNKTVNLTSNTLTGTTAQFNTALSDGDFATLAGTETLTNKTLTSPTVTSPVLNTSVSGTAVLDDDTFATASATTLATSESIKAYVDSLTGGTATLAGLTDTNITTPADGAVLFYDTATSKWIDNVVSGDITIADTGVATLASSVTITTPDINGGTIAGVNIDGNITASANITFGDNNKAIFGAGSDLQIYHDGNNKIEANLGYLRLASITSSTYVDGNNVHIRSGDGGETLARFNDDSDVKLYYDNAIKLATTVTGVDVTGTITADDITLSDADAPSITLTDTTNTLTTLIQSGNSTAIIGTTTNHDLRIQRNSADIVDVLSTGIDVTGTVTADGLTVDASGTIQINASTSDDFLTVTQTSGEAIITADSTAGTGNLLLKTTAAGVDSNRMRISGGGDIAFYDSTGASQNLLWDASTSRLGLGTTAPDRLLHLSSNAAIICIEDTAGAVNDKRAQIQVDNGQFEINSRNDDNSSRVDNIFVADLGTGNIGIGTASPATALDVNGTITADNVATPSINGGQIGGRRNLFYNGSFAVAQRGTSFASTSAPAYTLDRWYWNSQAEDVVTIEKSSDHPKGSGSSIKVTVTTADASTTDDYADIEQRIEGQDLQHLLYGTADAKSLTLSFWVKSSQTGDMAVGLYIPDDGRNIGSTVTISSANTWEYKTVTFAGDTTGVIDNDNGEGMRVWMHLLAGSDFTSVDNTTWGAYTTTRKAYGQTLNVLGTTSATFQLADVQLEVGSVATEFEHRSYGEELALCQRYYQNPSTIQNIFSGYVATGNVYYHSSTFPVQMRANPTMSYTVYATPLGFALAGIGGVSSAFGQYAYKTSTSTQNSGFYTYKYTADAEL